MDIGNFGTMVLNSMKKAGLPIAEVERIKENNSLLGIATSDDSQFLIKIEKREPGQEASFLETEEKDNKKIHDIYETFAESWEYSEMMMNNDFDIEWLLEKLDVEDYCKLEDYILYYSSRNDETFFELGFKYAWSLFTECAGGKNTGSTETRE